MKLTLKMNIDNKDFDLVFDLTNRAGRIYRQYFGRDAIKDLNALHKLANPNPFGSIDVSKVKLPENAKEDITEKDIIEALLQQIDTEKFEDVVFDFSHTEQAGQIIWAFAKNADDKLPNYEEWIDDFDFVLPVKEIIDVLYDAWNGSAQPTLELKN